MQDPETYLDQLGVRLLGAVDDGAPAILDSEHRSYVNWEVFFFSSPARREQFDADPLAYCGVVTDPVTKIRFRPDRGSPRFDYDGRPYYFASTATLERFKSMPAALAHPDLEMLQKGTDRP